MLPPSSEAQAVPPSSFSSFLARVTAMTARSSSGETDPLVLRWSWFVGQDGGRDKVYSESSIMPPPCPRNQDHLSLRVGVAGSRHHQRANPEEGKNR